MPEIRVCGPVVRPCFLPPRWLQSVTDEGVREFIDQKLPLAKNDTWTQHVVLLPRSPASPAPLVLVHLERKRLRVRVCARACVRVGKVVGAGR